MAPNWGHDIAFFHQWVHSAATGGPWASPLILEPQGFFAMVHTHLVMPLVVGLYALVSRQELVLLCHSAFACLAVVPLYRLGASLQGPRFGLLGVAALLCYGPFQSAATVDFRPLVLFLPGLLGVWEAARRGATREALLWAGVALCGRQEASYLLAATGGALCVVPWGGRRQWRVGAAILTLGLLSLVGWVLLKEQMFFHFNPLNPAPAPILEPEWAEARWSFAGSLLRSGWVLGLASPAGLIAALPLAREMLHTSREWTLLVGPGAHYHAAWLPFVAASGMAGTSRVMDLVGVRMATWKGWIAPAVLVANALAFPWIGPRTGPTELRDLTRQVDEHARVAADYDTIHALAGREVLWNIEQLYLPEDEKPLHWTDPWPLTLDEVDWVLMPADHPLGERLETWQVLDQRGRHVLLRRPVE
jgi:uncharacterized membrane protein